MSKIIAFTRVSLPFGWLGNMSPYPIEIDGVQYRTAEALFQCTRFEDPQIREEIRAQKSPIAAKMVAKKNAGKMVVTPCSETDVRNMETILMVKLVQNSQLIDQLKETGDATIIEDVTSRNSAGNHRFWGMALVDGEWVGENVLGKLWMKFRTQLREEQKGG